MTLARRLLLNYGYDEITDKRELEIIFDALAFHSCHSGRVPATLEGRAECRPAYQALLARYADLRYRAFLVPDTVPLQV